MWVALGLTWAACEPLELDLFPSRIDAGIDLADPVDSATPSGNGGAAALDPLPPDPPACLPGATGCEACLAAGACPAGRRCHPQTGECVLPCSSAQPVCPEPSVCNAVLGVCVGCIGNGNCPEDDLPLCHVGRGVCVECFDDSQCTSDPEERPVCLPELNRCGCESDVDCAVGICEASDDDPHCEVEDD